MQDSDRAGFDPWLVLFVAFVGVVLPVFYVFTCYLDMRATNARAVAMGLAGTPYTLVAQYVVGLAVRLGLCGYVLWRMLWARKPTTPRACAIAIALLFIGVPLLGMVANSLLYLKMGIAAGSAFEGAGAVLSRGCFLAFAGAWFLLRSPAVARTYGAAGEAREIFE